MRGQSSVLVMTAIIFVVIIFFGTLDYLQFLRYTIENEYTYVQQIKMLKSKQLVTFTEYVNNTNNLIYLNITNGGKVAVTIIGILVINNEKISVISENITLLPQQYAIVNTFISGSNNQNIEFEVVTSLGNVFI